MNNERIIKGYYYIEETKHSSSIILSETEAFPRCFCFALCGGFLATQCLLIKNLLYVSFIIKYSESDLYNFENMLLIAGLTSKDFARMGEKDKDKVLALIEEYNESMQNIPGTVASSTSQVYIDELKDLVEIYKHPTVEELYPIDDKDQKNKHTQVHIDGNTVYLDFYLSFEDSSEQKFDDAGVLIRDEKPSTPNFWDEPVLDAAGISLGYTYAEMYVQSIIDGYNFEFDGSSYDFLDGVSGELVTSVHVSNESSGSAVNSSFDTEKFNRNQKFTVVCMSDAKYNYGFNRNNGESIHLSTHGESLDDTKSIIRHEQMHSTFTSDSYSSDSALEDKGFVGGYNTIEAKGSNDIMNNCRGGQVLPNHVEMICEWASSGNTERQQMQPDMDDDYTISDAIRE